MLTVPVTLKYFLRKENWTEALVGQPLYWALDIVPHNQTLVWKESKLSSVAYVISVVIPLVYPRNVLFQLMFMIDSMT